MGGVVEARDPLAAVVVTDPAHEEGQSAGGVVVQGGEDLGDVEGLLTQGDEADRRLAHRVTLLGRAAYVGPMNDNPGDPPDGPDDGSQNPFKGTPFESLFGGTGAPDLGALFGGPGGAGGAARGALFSQIQSLMQPHDGPINWDYAIDIARKIVAQSPDPTPSQKQTDAVADAVRLADHWLDEATSFPSGVTSTAAWSRAEWIVGTTDVWKVLVEPVAERSVGRWATRCPRRLGRWPARSWASSARRSARCSPRRSAPASARSPERC